MDRRSSEPFDIGKLIGAAIKRSRIECRWTQAELADRLHSTQSQISRLESGTRQHIDGQLASRAMALQGIGVEFDAQTLGMAGRREQRDLVHATCSAYVARRLDLGGWESRIEVEIGTGRYRGWIDVLGFRRADRSLLIGEVKTEILDLGAIQRTLGWYEREAWTAARQLGWNAQRSTAVLLVLATAENDARVSVNRAGLKGLVPDDGTPASAVGGLAGIHFAAAGHRHDQSADAAVRMAHVDPVRRATIRRAVRGLSRRGAKAQARLTGRHAGMAWIWSAS